MKGVMGFLERSGFVRATGDADGEDPSLSTGAVGEATEPMAPAVPIAEQLVLSLQDIYAAAGVAPSVYPAEKLVRLLDGLKMMDEATRNTAVAAMDAADDGWSISDPIQDAMAKVDALSNHEAALRQGIQQAETETTALIQQVKEREAAAVTTIRQQITELEGLMTREIERSAQDQAALHLDLQTKREDGNRRIEVFAATKKEFRLLIAQFGAATEVPQTPAASA